MSGQPRRSDAAQVLPGAPTAATAAPVPRRRDRRRPIRLDHGHGWTRRRHRRSDRNGSRPAPAPRARTGRRGGQPATGRCRRRGRAAGPRRRPPCRRRQSRRRRQRQAALRDGLRLSAAARLRRGAVGAFEDFLTRYPQDPLAGNAQYWLGETHYVRGEYRAARQRLPQGLSELRGQRARLRQPA